MKYTFLFIFSLLFFPNSTAQEEIASFSIKAKSTMKKKEALSFSNKETGDLALFVIEGKNVFPTLLNSDFKKKAGFEAENIKKKYSQIIGYRVEGERYVIIASDNKHKKYVAQTVDFSTKTSVIEEYKFDFDKEHFLTAVQYKNDMILIHANKENNFILRKLNVDNTFSEIKTFVIDVDKRDQELLKSGFFEVGLFGTPRSNITKIDNRVPNAIDQTTASNKLYRKGDILYLTLENDEDLNTIMHTINLESLSLSTKVYNYPKGKKNNFKKFNSYILEDHIFQLGSSQEEMTIQIKSFNDALVKEYYIDSEEAIQIKNSPIIQEKDQSLFAGRREMEKTKKFLRKVTSSDIGVTAYREDGEYKITIGGIKEMPSGGGGMMMGPGAGFGVPMGVVGGVGIGLMYNPTWYSYNSFSNTKSTYFNTTFNNDFDYVAKEDEANIFERIDEFKRGLKYDTAEDVFFHNDTLYFSYFDNKAKVYHIYKM